MNKIVSEKKRLERMEEKKKQKTKVKTTVNKNNNKKAVEKGVKSVKKKEKLKEIVNHAVYRITCTKKQYFLTRFRKVIWISSSHLVYVLKRL